MHIIEKKDKYKCILMSGLQVRELFNYFSFELAEQLQKDNRDFSKNVCIVHYKKNNEIFFTSNKELIDNFMGSRKFDLSNWEKIISINPDFFLVHLEDFIDCSNLTRGWYETYKDYINTEKICIEAHINPSTFSSIIQSGEWLTYPEKYAFWKEIKYLTQGL